MDEWGKACLSDFGMAGIKTYTISLSSIARPATLFGSLQWMAPEQIIESKANKKTDIYSFGMTIYEVGETVAQTGFPFLTLRYPGLRR